MPVLNGNAHAQIDFASTPGKQNPNQQKKADGVQKPGAEAPNKPNPNRNKNKKFKIPFMISFYLNKHYTLGGCKSENSFAL